MSASTPDKHPTGKPNSQHCPVCRQLRMERQEPHTFVVTPADGGGWQLWSPALLRFFQRIGSQPTQAVTIDQPALSERYVQVMIGHGIAHAEASSNVYLSGDSHLTSEHENLLERLGWVAPEADHDDPDEWPANWHLPLIHDDWEFLAEMLVATIIGVFGFSGNLPVEVRSFAADEPCRAPRGGGDRTTPGRAAAHAELCAHRSVAASDLVDAPEANLQRHRGGARRRRSGDSRHRTAATHAAPHPAQQS